MMGIWFSDVTTGRFQRGAAFVVLARLVPGLFRRKGGDPPLPRLRSGSSEWDYLGAREATMFSKRGSPRNGSQLGSSFN
jgi:hypothetical protein